MKKYSISEIEKLTGIKAHTIRIWEKRYNILCNERTDTNIRFYNDAELKRFINIALLIEGGHRISKIACLDSDALCHQVQQLTQAVFTEKVYIDRFIAAMVEMDELKFHDILNECIQKKGFVHCITRVLYPFLQRIGVMWQTGNITPVQEHFISNLIRQKIIAETDKLDYRDCNGSCYVLFLPTDELHEIGLLFYNYYLRTKGCKVYYLGQSVPFDNLKQVFDSVHPEYLITYFVGGKSADKMQAYLQNLEQIFTGKTIFITGEQCKKVNMESLHKSMHICSFDDFLMQMEL